MLFNSLHFLFFFPICCLIFFNLTHRFQTVFLLVASYYFYMAWEPIYGLLIMATTTVDYFVSFKLRDTLNVGRRKAWLCLSLFSHLSILLIFKYAFFLNGLLSHGYHLERWILPVGISFYTFQAIGYLIDVYRRDIEPEEDFIVLALFIIFFPQLVAGPIEKAKELIPQFKSVKTWDWPRASEGLNLIIVGFFKKMVIADRCGIYVDAIHKNIQNSSSLSLFLASFFFSLQLYCDFSGYSDIARGTAHLMGFELKVNFRQPLLEHRFSMLIRNWHISLSDWFRSYIFKPMGGWRKNLSRAIFNFMLVMTISGIWHGSSWTFLCWSTLVGLFYLADHFTPSIPIPLWAKYLLAQLAWILSLIFFRSSSIGEAQRFFSGLCTRWDLTWDGLRKVLVPFTYDSHFFAHALVAFFMILVFWQLEIKCRQQNLGRNFICFLLAMIIIFGKFNEKIFIYYQF